MIVDGGRLEALTFGAFWWDIFPFGQRAVRLLQYRSPRLLGGYDRHKIRGQSSGDSGCGATQFAGPLAQGPNLACWLAGLLAGLLGFAQMGLRGEGRRRLFARSPELVLHVGYATEKRSEPARPSSSHHVVPPSCLRLPPAPPSPPPPPSIEKYKNGKCKTRKRTLFVCAF